VVGGVAAPLQSKYGQSSSFALPEISKFLVPFSAPADIYWQMPEPDDIALSGIILPFLMAE